MPALQSCSTGIDVQQPKPIVILHLENVAMSADEKLGRMVEDLLANAWVVMAGISADVCHQDVGSFTSPTEFFGIETAQVASIAVPEDSPKRTKLLQSHGQFQRTDVARMPYLVARLEVLEITLVPIGMRVAKESYSYHLLCLRVGTWRRGGGRGQRGLQQSTGCAGEGGAGGMSMKRRSKPCLPHHGL